MQARTSVGEDDKDVTEADFAEYHGVLLGDPGGNKWIAKLNGKLPVKWTKETVTLAATTERRCGTITRS